MRNVRNLNTPRYWKHYASPFFSTENRVSMPSKCARKHTVNTNAAQVLMHPTVMIATLPISIPALFRITRRKSIPLQAKMKNASRDVRIEPSTESIERFSSLSFKKESRRYVAVNALTIPITRRQ